MFKTKLSLLLIAIFLLNIDFLLSYPAFATQDPVSGTEHIKFTSKFNSTGNFNRASDPECGAFKTAATIAGIAIVLGGVITGIALMISSAGLFTALVIVGMIAVVVGVWKSIGGLVVCEHSFVKHPVARDHNGRKKDFKLKDISHSKCTDQNYITEGEYFKCFDKNKSVEAGREVAKNVLDFITDQDADNYYWPKNSVQYSEYIEVCHRNPLTFGRIFSERKKDEKDEKKGFNLREVELKYITAFPWTNIDGELECKVLKAGESKLIHGSTFRAVTKIGRLCVELASIKGAGSAWPQGINIGCTDLPPDPLAPMCKDSKMKFKNSDGTDSIEVSIGEGSDYKTFIRAEEKKGKVFAGYNNKNCFKSYISEACYNQAGSKSLAPIPITSMIVQCIKESLDNLVAGKYTPDGKSFLFVAQKRLKNTVTAVLLLALMLFSIKVISGGVRNPQEIYMLIIKFALVMYFTLGNTMFDYYQHLTKLSNGLSEIVLKASSESKSICNYEAKSYIDGSYYLAPWDKLDCRLLFYLGAPLDGIAGKIGTGGVITLAVLLGAAPILLVAGSVIGTIAAGGQILVALVAIFMGILMMMVVLWICYVFILSLVALSVIVILSPLFIPMVLFQHTKGYFDGWVRELITYSLYPVILSAFLSFMFIACDKVFFKNLNFEKEEITILDGHKKQWFKLKDGECDRNENTLACMLQTYSFKKSTIFGLFDFMWVGFNSSIIGELLKLSLILFLFYHFLNILPGMAAELAGNHRAALGSGSTPGQMVNKALSAARAASGDVSEIAKAVAKKFAQKSAEIGRSSGPQSSPEVSSENISQSNS